MDHDVIKTHPLYKQDRPIVDRMLASIAPAAEDIADCGRLLIRYEGYPGCPDIKADLQRCLARWTMTRDELNFRCRRLWAGGWRPAILDHAEVGSGADVSAS